jgi:hypothetical protein
VEQNKDTLKRTTENISINEATPIVNRERSPNRNKKHHDSENIFQQSLNLKTNQNDHVKQPSSPKIQSKNSEQLNQNLNEIHKPNKSPQHQITQKNMNHLNPSNSNDESHLAGKRKSLKKSKQSYNELNNNTDNINTSLKTQQTPKQTNKPQTMPTSRNTLKSNERIFIALYNYDPLTMSPNIDTCNEELDFQEGQLIKVIGDQDADGFYFGETQGKSGYIPCNLISEVQIDDPVILEQLLSEIYSDSSKNIRTK